LGAGEEAEKEEEDKGLYGKKPKLNEFTRVEV